MTKDGQTSDGDRARTGAAAWTHAPKTNAGLWENGAQRSDDQVWIGDQPPRWKRSRQPTVDPKNSAARSLAGDFVGASPTLTQEARDRIRIDGVAAFIIDHLERALSPENDPLQYSQEVVVPL
jgi:hypothetical protein